MCEIWNTRFCLFGRTGLQDFQPEVAQLPDASRPGKFESLDNVVTAMGRWVSEKVNINVFYYLKTDWGTDKYIFTDRELKIYLNEFTNSYFYIFDEN